MVNKGLVKLDDPIENYLPSYVTVPQYNGHKITIEDLATHTSGLPEFPDNYCPSFDPAKTGDSRFSPIPKRFNELYQELYI